jgi:hypothetical protein
MESSLDFATYTQWSIYTTIAFFVLALLGFVFKWGIRFRLVGTAGFMIVLTIGLWGLSLGLFSHKTIAGAKHFNLVYDNGANQAVIAVPVNITETELEATLKQAANNLVSSGRTGIGSDNKLTVRARVLVHSEDKLTKPLYVGQVKTLLGKKDNLDLEIEISTDKLAQISAKSEIKS